MKTGSGRRVNMIKKTGNLLAVKNTALLFTRAPRDAPEERERKRGGLVFTLAFNAHESRLPCIRLLLREALHF